MMKTLKYTLIFSLLVILFALQTQIAAQETEEDPIEQSDSPDDNKDYKKFMIGASLSYGEFYIGRDVRISNSKSISGNESTVGYTNVSPSIILKFTPDALIPHVFTSSSLVLINNEKTFDNTLYKTNILGARYGLYFNTGNLYSGDVGFYTGVYAGLQGALIQGRFRSNIEFRDTYIQMSVLIGQSNMPDYLDTYVAYRGIKNNLDSDDKNLYIAYRGGAIDRDTYILASLTRAGVNPLELLVLTDTSSTNLDYLYMYHLLSSESKAIKGSYAGYTTGVEIGYYGDFFLLSYDASIGNLQDLHTSFDVENHKVTAGIFLKF